MFFKYVPTINGTKYTAMVKKSDGTFKKVIPYINLNPDTFNVLTDNDTYTNLQANSVDFNAYNHGEWDKVLYELTVSPSTATIVLSTPNIIKTGIGSCLLFVEKGTQVSYTISNNDYKTETGTKTIESNTSETIVLRKTSIFLSWDGDITDREYVPNPLSYKISDDLFTEDTIQSFKIYAMMNNIETDITEGSVLQTLTGSMSDYCAIYHEGYNIAAESFGPISAATAGISPGIYFMKPSTYRYISKIEILLS